MGRLIDADELTEHMYREAVDTRTKIANLIKSASTIDAIPIDWIEAEIKRLRAMNFELATMTAGMIEAMLKRWKEEQEGE